MRRPQRLARRARPAASAAAQQPADRRRPPGGGAPGSESVTTGFAPYPQTLRAHCSTAAGASVLHVGGGLAGHPVAELQRLGPAWGVHVTDVNVALGHLVRLVGREAAAWRG